MTSCFIFPFIVQELAPTADIGLVRSLMNLMDCLMEEFTDAAKIKQMNERDICSWLEVGTSFDVNTFSSFLEQNCVMRFGDVFM